jgi:Primase X
MSPSLGYRRHDQKESEFIANLDFILSHFEEPIWPRTISTHATEGRQILAYNKDDAITRYKQSSLLDCRINAFPNYTEYRGINRQAPNFLFLDLDRCAFGSEKAFKTAYSKTLRNLSDTLGAKSPTVLWSGNGYHIYQPLEAFPLEQEQLFASKTAEPSKEFLQFAEQYLTNYKSDQSHHPSFKSCMIRIPGSHNFKLVQKNNNGGVADSSTEVKIIQRWDGVKPKFNPLLYHFNIWLADKKIKEINESSKRSKYHHHHKYNATSIKKEIKWIEILLQTPVEDYRKNAIWRILAPYLINIKNLNYEESYNIIKEWLDKCNSLKRLDFSYSYYIKYNLNSTIKVGYFPMKFDDLKDENIKLYNILKDKISDRT